MAAKSPRTSRPRRRLDAPGGDPDRPESIPPAEPDSEPTSTRRRRAPSGGSPPASETAPNALAELEARNQSLERQLRESQEAHGEAARRLDALGAALKEAEARLRDGGGGPVAPSHELERTREALLVARARVADLERERDERRAEPTPPQDEAEALRARVASLEAALSERAELEATLAQLRERAGSLEAELADRDRALASLRETPSVDPARLQALEAELSAERKRFEERELSLRHELEAERVRVHEAQGLASAAEREKLKAQVQLAQLDHALDVAKGRAEEQAVRATEEAGQRERLAAELADVKTALAAAQEELGRHAGPSQHEAWELERRGLLARIFDLEERLRFAEAQPGSAGAVMKKMRDELWQANVKATQVARALQEEQKRRAELEAQLSRGG